MIEIKDLTKCYENRKILNSINVSFENKGFIAVLGPSGCGKSTLLNCLGGLIEFDGSIIIDNIEIKNIKNIDDFRIDNIGFVFQDFKLYEKETVANNIMFPLDVVSNDSRYRKTRKCQDLLTIIDLKGYENNVVENLSGGQKQRVAIARALSNDPKIILADEPTGSLDNANSEQIMQLLKQISSTILVIVVSHDKKLVEKYADKIIVLKDGEIKEIKEGNNFSNKRYYVPLCETKKNRRYILSNKFLLQHTINSIRQRKGRNILSNIVMSLSLIGIGGSITLSSLISENIMKSYSSIIDTNNLNISLREETVTDIKYAASFYETKEFAKDFEDKIIDVGFIYKCDFENFFIDADNMYLLNSKSKNKVNNFSSRSINEYKWIEEITSIVYPQLQTNLKEDEIILALTIDNIEKICFDLQIERTVTSLSNYLLNNELFVYFDFANFSWQYTDQQIFKVVGFTIEIQNGIYHSNHLWNELIFEERMRFPTSDVIGGRKEYPWIMEKIPYINLSCDSDIFLTNTFNKNFDNNFVFEIINEIYMPWFCRNVDVKDLRRIMIFANPLVDISYKTISHLHELDNQFTNPILGCKQGYSIYPSSLMAGFSAKSYFSFSENELNQVLDSYSSMVENENENEQLPNAVISGYFAYPLQSSVKFKTLSNQKIYGRKPNRIDEVAISTKLYKKLNGDSKFTEKQMYFSYTTKETILSGNKIYREYTTRPLKVVGIIDEDKYLIYQENIWTIVYFQTRFNITAFDLQINTLSYEILENIHCEELINKVNKSFPKLVATNPLQEINNSVNNVCFWIKICLLIFSSVSIVISLFLLSICNYLHTFESRKDIALARCIGINQKESKKFIFMHSFVMSFISFLISAVELIIVSLLISFYLSSNLQTEFTFSFDVSSLIAMAITAVFISSLSSFLTSKEVKKIKPLDV